MNWIRRHWLPLAVALVLAVLLFDARRDALVMDRELVAMREDVARANERAAQWRREVGVRSAIADSLKSEMDRLEPAAVEYVTRWRTRVDTLTKVETVALADSAIGACVAALGACAATVAAKDAVIAAQDSAIAARGDEVAALDTYARELEQRLRGGDPIWPTLVLGAGGGVLGYALEGPDGAFVGVGIGVGVDVVRRGVKSLVGSLP